MNTTVFAGRASSPGEDEDPFWSERAHFRATGGAIRLLWSRAEEEG